MSKGTENLSREQMVQVIDFFAYRMDLKLRGQLMAHLPQVYNTLVDQEIVRVVHVHGGDAVPVTRKVLTSAGEFVDLPVTYGGDR